MIFRPRGISKIDFYRFRIFSNSALSVVPDADRPVLVREQSLGKFRDHSDDTDQGHRAPKIQTRRLQVVGGPDDVDGLKESAPVKLA
jgi:hypothetical protein